MTFQGKGLASFLPLPRRGWVPAVEFDTCMASQAKDSKTLSRCGLRRRPTHSLCVVGPLRVATWTDAQILAIVLEVGACVVGEPRPTA